MLELFLEIYRQGRELLDQDVPLDRIQNAFNLSDLVRLRNQVPNDALDRLKQRRKEILENLKNLAKKQEQTS